MTTDDDTTPEAPAQPAAANPEPEPAPATIEPVVPLLSPLTENFPIAASVEADEALISEMTRAESPATDLHTRAEESE